MRRNNLPSGRGGPLRRVNRDLDPPIRDCRCSSIRRRFINRTNQPALKRFESNFSIPGAIVARISFPEKRSLKDDSPINVHFFLPRKEGRAEGGGSETASPNDSGREGRALPSRAAREEWKRCARRRVYLVCN